MTLSEALSKIQELEADNAAMRDCLHKIGWYEAPKGVTDWGVTQNMSRLALSALSTPHPGARLLERMKKLERILPMLRDEWPTDPDGSPQIYAPGDRPSGKTWAEWIERELGLDQDESGGEG